MDRASFDIPILIKHARPMRKTVTAMMPKISGRLKASVRALRATKTAAVLLAIRIAAISRDINDSN